MRFAAALVTAAAVLAGCGGGGSSSSRSTTSLVTTSAPAPAATARNPVALVRTFAAQLQNVGENGPDDAASLAALASSPYQLVLIDEIGTSTSAYASTESAIVAQLHAAGKLAIGYVDIGEAEDYRSYWQPAWTPGSPSFLLPYADPNGFSGDEPVDFSDPRWQAIVYGSPGSLIDRAIADGFDGVYLDWVEAIDFPPILALHANAPALMSQFVAGISLYAKTAKPGFAIVAESSPELVGDARFVASIDAVLQEDAFFLNSPTAAGDIPQTPAQTQAIVAVDKRYLAAGKTVFSIDYATTAANAAAAYAGATAAGFIEYVSDRDLQALSAFPPAAASATRRAATRMR